MAQLIDLGAAQRALYMSMFNDLYGNKNRYDLTREIDRQSDEARKDLAEQRLLAESRARQADSAARLGISRERAGAYIAAEQERQKMEDEQIARGKEASDRAERQMQPKIDLMRAQTGAASAAAEASHAAALERAAATEKNKLEAQGLSAKNARDAADALVKDSERGYNFAISMAQGGHKFDKDETDKFVANARHLGDDRFFDVPRNPDGSWNYDPKTVAQQFPIVDQKGMPTTKLAEGIRKLQQPESDFGRKLHDVRDILEDPTSSEYMKHAATAGLTAMYSPTVPKIQGDLVQRLVDVGAYPQAINLMKDFQTKEGGGKPNKPSAKSTTDMQDRLALIQTQNELLEQWHDLRGRGLYPTGVLRKPILDTLRDLGVNNADVEGFRKLLNLQVSQYMTLMHGRRYMEKEMEFIKNSLPSDVDSAATFESVLRSMRKHMVTDVQTRAGALKMFGIDTPGITPRDPADVIRGGESLPGLEFNDAYVPPQTVRDMAIGLDILRKQDVARGLKIGGVGEFRDNQMGADKQQAGISGLGMTPVPPEQPETPPPSKEDKMREEIAKMTPDQIRKELQSMSPEVTTGEK